MTERNATIVIAATGVVNRKNTKTILLFDAVTTSATPIFSAIFKMLIEKVRCFCNGLFGISGGTAGRGTSRSVVLFP